MMSSEVFSTLSQCNIFTNGSSKTPALRFLHDLKSASKHPRMLLVPILRDSIRLHNMKNIQSIVCVGRDSSHYVARGHI